jgi:hypothetical protein
MTMIPVEPFASPIVGSREYNAVKKAVSEKPPVRLLTDRELDEGDAVQFYEVKSQYTVRVYRDLDQQHFIECGCLAGSPPIDPATGLPTREASPCYHAASVLLFIAEQEKEK